MSKRETQNNDIQIHLQEGMIDSHFHSLVMAQKELNAEAVLSRCVSEGLSAGIDIGTKAGDSGERAWVREKFPGMLLAAGLYPSEAEYEDLQARLSILEKDLQNFSIRAIGEIGVDLYWNYASTQRQKELMAAQIGVANRYDLPIIIHNREADQAILEVLSKNPPEAGGIMHCFSSDSEAAKDFLDQGLYISFAGNISYKKSHDIREAARYVPLDRILLETDSPYLSPQKVRGKVNHPGHIGYSYELMAELKGISLDSLIERVQENFFTLFPVI